MKKLALAGLVALELALSPISIDAQNQPDINVEVKEETLKSYSKIHKSSTFSAEVMLERVYHTKVPEQKVMVPCSKEEKCKKKEIIIPEKKLDDMPGFQNIAFWRYPECSKDNKPVPYKGQHMSAGFCMGYYWNGDCQLLAFHDYNCDFIVDDFSGPGGEQSSEEILLKFNRNWYLMVKEAKNFEEEFKKWLEGKKKK